MVAHVPLISRTGALSHDLSLRLCIQPHLSKVSIRLPLLASPVPLVILCYSWWSSFAWRSQLFPASTLCHLVMKRSAASNTPRGQSLLFLAALGRSIVLLRTAKGSYSWTPRWLRIHLSRLLDTGPRSFQVSLVRGFSPPAIVPNNTRWVSHSFVVGRTAPEK